MPRYDYRCHKCQHIEEVFEGVNDNKNLLHICVKCGEPMHRLLSAVPHVWTKNHIKIRHGIPE